MRAFIAIPVTDAVRKRLAALQDRLRGAGADVKWVEPGNIHLTLKFLGALSEEARGTLDAGLRAAARAAVPFELEVHGTGAFPAQGAPRVVWAGCIERRPMDPGGTGVPPLRAAEWRGDTPVSPGRNPSAPPFSDVAFSGQPPADGLVALARAVERAAAAAGFPPEGRPFASHVTLGRVRSPRNAARLRGLLEADAGGVFGTFRVEAFVLYRSDLSPRGPAYTGVERYGLATF